MIPIANTPLPIVSLVNFFPLGTNVLLINHQFTKSIGKFMSSSHWFIITRYWHELLVKLQAPFCSIVIYLDRNTKLLVLKCCCFFTWYSMLTMLILFTFINHQSVFRTVNFSSLLLPPEYHIAVVCASLFWLLAT